MAQQIVNTGTTPNDKTGDSIRAAFIKVNNNFNEVYSVLNVNDNLRISGSSLVSVNTNGNIIIDPNGTGITRINSNTFVYGDFSVSGNSATAGNATITGTLTVTGNANVGNLGSNNGVFTGTLSATGNANVGNLGTAGLIVATGNVTGGNLITGGIVSATGNVSGGNLTTAGVVTATGNVSGGNLTTTGQLSVTGNANVGNIGAVAGVFTGAVSITGNANVGNLNAGNVNAGNITITGDVIKSSNATITIDPTTTGVGGTVVIAGNLQVTGTTTTVNSTTVEVADLNLTLAKDAASAAAADGAGITVAGATANIYYSSSDDRWNFNKTINGTITTANNSSYLGGVAAANYLQTTGSGSSLTSLPAGNLSGTIPSGVLGNSTVYVGTTAIALNRTSASQTLTGVSIDGSAGSATSATTAGTVTTAAQGNITSLGTLTSLAVTGNVAFSGANVSLGAVGNLHIGGGSSGYILSTDGAGTLSWVSAGTATSAQYVTEATQGNITTTANLISVGNITTGTWSANIGAVSGANLTAVPGANITGTIPSGVLGNSTVYIGTTSIALNRTSASQSLTGVNIDGSAGSATTAGTVTTAAQGNITSVGTLTSLTVSGAITPNANGTINIGNATNYFGTIYGLATSAKYADVAEIYESDADYEPGTVVMFGGEKEITTTVQYGQTAVAGVVSTNPAYLMNSAAKGLPVALLGRVPCKVIGPVVKGDFIVSSNVPGVGIGSTYYVPGAVIGKSLVNKTTDSVELIEVVVGRL